MPDTYFFSRRPDPLDRLDDEEPEDLDDEPLDDEPLLEPDEDETLLPPPRREEELLPEDPERTRRLDEAPVLLRLLLAGCLIVPDVLRTRRVEVVEDGTVRVTGVFPEAVSLLTRRSEPADASLPRRRVTTLPASSPLSSTRCSAVRRPNGLCFCGAEE